jgi:hypothetical protein
VKIDVPDIPISLAAYRRYTIQQVARLVNLNDEYFWQCLRAAKDEEFRKERKIPRSTLAALPLMDWRRQGRKSNHRSSIVSPVPRGFGTAQPCPTARGNRAG